MNLLLQVSPASDSAISIYGFKLPSFYPRTKFYQAPHLSNVSVISSYGKPINDVLKRKVAKLLTDYVENKVKVLSIKKADTFTGYNVEFVLEDVPEVRGVTLKATLYTIKSYGI